jgi:hypothetical protein
MIFSFIGKLDIFPFMCATDKVWITELTLIHKNIRSVRNSRSIWHKTHYDITDKNNNISSEDLDRLITNIPAHPIRLTEILVIMSVSTFRIVVVLICLNFLKERLLLSKISPIKTLNILILQLKPWQGV